MCGAPDFAPTEGRWPYTFRRRRRFEGEAFYDIIAISSSQKYHMFDAGVAWGLFPTWSGSLGRHEIRAGRGLAYLCGRHTLKDQVYEYDGSEAGARDALRRISSDVADVAEPWFDEQVALALAHPLVRLGLDWVRGHPETRSAKQGHAYNQEVREKLSRVLRRRAFELSLEPETKKNISLLTYHLLEFASEVDGRT